jgi:hypothetical protein
MEQASYAAWRAFLAIVDDLDVVRVGSEPAEVDAPLIVDSDAVLASPVPGEFFKAIHTESE